MKTDLVVIGAGPAGLQAAMHAARAKIKVLVLGKMLNSSIYGVELENYFGVELVNGSSLLEAGYKKAKEFGAEFLEEDVVAVSKNNEGFNINLESETCIEAKAIVIATGVSRNRLGVKGEREYKGHGVSYCVDCDAGFFRGKDVVIVGNGSAAADGALLMREYAKRVVFVCNDLKINKILEAKVKESGIEIISNNWIKEIKGDGAKVEALVLEDNREIKTDGLFIELGAKGGADLFMNLGINLDPKKMSYIQVRENQESNIPGIFAAGDICGIPFQLAKAVGQGCIAALAAVSFVKR